MVNRRPLGVIDVHAHVCPSRFNVSPELAGNERMPCMCHGAPGEAELMIGGKSFRKLDSRSWDIARRIEDMDRDGVAIQALSPMPELLSYWFSPRDGAEMCDFMNGCVAAMVAQAPARFAGLGMVPLQDVDLAVQALRRAKEVYNLAGVQIGTNIGGVLPGDARFEPFWAAAAALELAVFIHPLHPLSAKIPDVSPLFHPLAGFLADTAFAGASLLLGGVLTRHPNLRVGLSHGGGGLVPVIPRLDHAFATMAAMRAGVSERPSETASRLFYDTNIYDAPYLAYLARDFAPGRVFLGTDYPYEIMQTDPAAYLARLGLPEAVMDSLAHGAARRFLRLA